MREAAPGGGGQTAIVLILRVALGRRLHVPAFARFALPSLTDASRAILQAAKGSNHGRSVAPPLWGRMASG